MDVDFRVTQDPNIIENRSERLSRATMMTLGVIDDFDFRVVTTLMKRVRLTRVYDVYSETRIITQS